MKGSGFPVTRLFILVVVALVLLGAVAFFAVQRLEGTGPEVSLKTPPRFLGANTKFAGTVSDRKNGLRSLRISILDNQGKETVLLDESYPSPGFLARGNLKEKDFDVAVEPRKIGLTDGKAMLRIHSTDYSLRDWGKGNATYLEIPLAVDTKPPVVSVLTQAHNVIQGGAGLVIYRVSEKTPRSGVRVGDHFYAGAPGPFSDELVYMSLFAFPYDQPLDTRMTVEAEDEAGNRGNASFYQHVKPKRFRSDSMNLSDRFLEEILPRFEPITTKDGSDTMIAKYLAINRDLRKQNEDLLMSLYRKSEPRMKWEGVFDRLRNGAPMAQFADHRSYVYEGQVVDEQTHKGFDLASLASSPVPAANSGTVVYADTLGIYGLTVAIDHGYGLLSHYSHLSRIDVNVGQEVKKGDVVGLTGSTGLAGGDHLHYGILVDDTFVNPIEWWDPHWIKDNVMDKISSVKQSLGQAVERQ
ncbi:MAG: M23 family metallopeptidase [Thermodesulfobacteriota bacterium]